MERAGNEAMEVRLDWKAELAALETLTTELYTDKEKEKAKGERIVMWEKFLPRRSLRILVAEADDSTRQIVSALLRNCSYQVGDGLLAWGLLEDPSNCFDLVLTEVALASLSGINLLYKIMSHETLKHIPVIMMSSLDSMSIVFKCLTKGAVDFLVKPVRKNELQNLWQHVWRRCHSSSGSGSGRQNQNAAQRKNEAGYDKNTGSIGGSDNASSGLDIREGSDNGSGTQTLSHQTWQVTLEFGSWTNQYVEVESSHRRGKWKQHCSYGNKFSLVKQSKKDKTQNNWMQSVETSAKACDDVVPRRVPTHVECLKEESTLHDRFGQNQEVDCPASCREGDHLGAESVKEGSKPSAKAIDLIGNMGRESQCRNGDQEVGWSREGKIDTRVKCCHGKDKSLTDYNCMPELELTLNRPQANSNECSKLKDQSLRQSDASAFSRYNTGGTHFSCPWGGSFPVNLYPENKKQYCVSSENTGSLNLTVPFEKLGSSNGSAGYAPDKYQLLQSTNNQERGSSVIGLSGQAAGPSSVPMKDDAPVSLPTGVAVSIPPGVISFDGVAPAYGSQLHPMFYSYPGVPICGSDTPLKAEREDARDNSSYHEPHYVSLHVPDHSHHYNHLHHHHIQYHHHHHHHHHHKGHEHKKHARQDERAVDNAATTAQGGSYIMPRNTLSLDGNCGESGSSNGHGSNGNADRSASGSNNNGINMPTGQSTVAVIPGTNGGSGTGNTVTSTTGSGVENNLSARREAALMKFRQKRKERCFEKKVRYQSRKMFAEQRPRVKGQFVRHLSINKSEAGEEK